MNFTYYRNNPKKIISSLCRYFDFYLLDIINTFISFLVLVFFPKKFFEFHNVKKKANINLNNKEILLHWITKHPKKKFKEINILFRGNSLKKSLKQVNTYLPTFAVNIFFKPKNFKSYYGITASVNDRIKMIEKKIIPTLFVASAKKINKGKILWKKEVKVNYKKINNLRPFELGVTHKYIKHLPCGSGLAAIFALEKISNKINIYGCDHYLDKNAKKYNFINLLKELCLFNGKSSLYGTRRRKFFLEAVINYYYLSRLLKIKKFSIYGNVRTLKSHSFILKKINLAFS